MDDAGERHDHRTNHGIKTDRGGTPSQKGTRQQPLIKLMAARKSPPRRGYYGKSPRIDKRNRDRKDKEENGKTHAPEITSNKQATSHQSTKSTHEDYRSGKQIPEMRPVLNLVSPIIQNVGILASMTNGTDNSPGRLTDPVVRSATQGTHEYGRTPSYSNLEKEIFTPGK